MSKNLKISEELLDDVLKLSGCRTRSEAVAAALEEFVARRRQLQVLKFRGKIDFDKSYSYKQQRKRT